MSKVTINQDKLRISEDMQSSEEKGTLIYAKKEITDKAQAERNETNDKEEKDAADE